MYLLLVLEYAAFLAVLACALTLNLDVAAASHALYALSGFGFGCFFFRLFRDPFPRPTTPFRSIRTLLGEPLLPAASRRGLRGFPAFAACLEDRGAADVPRHSSNRVRVLVEQPRHLAHLKAFSRS